MRCVRRERRLGQHCRVDVAALGPGDVVTDGRGGLGELRRVQRFAGEEGGTLEHDGAEVENDPLRPGEVASERLVAVATARLGIPRTSRW